MPFAQLVIGSPGAGKSTYCYGMFQFMTAIGRKCSVVNLDPANDHTAYPAALDVRDLVSLEEVMEAEELGPNGGVLYALEELEHNFEWLEEGLKELGEDYILFDCPGQVELFTHHASLRNIFLRLQKLGYRLVVVSLTDSFVLSQPSLYISALLLALRGMLQLDLPHLNVLTKIDNLPNYGDLPFNLDFYTEVQSLDYLLPHLAREQRARFGGGAAKRRKKVTERGKEEERKTPDAGADADTNDAAGDSESAESDEDSDDETNPTSKFTGLNRALVQLIDDYALVGFETLAVEDKRSMLTLLRAVDRAGGYAFGPGTAGATDTVWEVAMRQDATTMDARDVQERWLDRRAEWDAREREEWEREARELGGQGRGTGGGGGDGEMEMEERGEEGEDDEDLEKMQERFRKAMPAMRTTEGGGVKIVRKG